ncbi:TetR/AcrR family transcriptional regulator [Aeromicrobium sp. 9AM]|uniref:TetR/AcrR family transcriptional regulator n=1 Tax=Aeromicrobium sp. 9AM TaxID=2653126 RepID=UPI0012F21D42|nr:TetR/AcrR family transcriptional regulator [Aeromicrobium sp. 9AM]VXA94287.1 TetR family transcriptional regulator [Aeromicrobium sp. 9AM]
MPRVGLTTEKVAVMGAELADELGFDQVTISEIARRCGVRVASLYSHVKGSDDLRDRIAVMALDDLADRGGEALAGRSGRDALVALGNVYRDYAIEHPGRYDAARLPVTDEDAGRRHSQMMRAILRGYDLTDADETHAVRLLGSIFHGFISLERGGGFERSEPSSAESWERILETLDAMLLSWPRTNAR